MKTYNLKLRIIVSIVITLTITSALFGTGLILIKQKLEEATFGRMVKDQLETILAQPNPEKVLSDSVFKGWEFYREKHAKHLPDQIKQLPPGSYHSVKVEDRYLHLEVKRHNGELAYLLYDVTEWEEQEHALLKILAGGVILVLLGGILMGARSARTILAPIRKLTDRVSGIQPGQRNIRLAGEFEGSEISQIAVAVDGYLERLDQFVEREQSFSAAASHELRTPLSVIMGAVDILDVDTQSMPAQRALGRIKRACADMLAFIEATLFLSRENSNSINHQSEANLAEIISTLLDDMDGQFTQRNIKVESNVEFPLVVDQPGSILQITVGNILRNALEHSGADTVTITLTDERLIITDNGNGIEADVLPYVFDASYTTKSEGNGLGLNLVKRICDRFKWQLEVTSRPEQGCSIIIQFTRPIERKTRHA